MSLKGDLGTLGERTSANQLRGLKGNFKHRRGSRAAGLTQSRTGKRKVDSDGEEDAPTAVPKS